MGETSPEVAQKENPCMHLLIFMASQTDHTKNTNHATVKREGLIILKRKEKCTRVHEISSSELAATL